MPYDARADLAREREDLVKADRHIAAGEQRISHQCELIESLRRKSQQVLQAESLLETLRQTLQTWQEHRLEIVRRISYLESRSSTQQNEADPKD